MPISPAIPTQTILGVPFYTGDFTGLLQRTQQGGLIVVPSAPVLVGLADDPAHRAAVEGADLAITDSGFMVLLWRLFRREKLPRYSGLKYIRALLQEPDFRAPGKTFWVMPTPEDAAANLAWLNGQGFALSEADTYVAPLYPRTGTLADPALLATILARQPDYVMLNLGGGVQERLGFHLREALLSAISKQRSDVSDQTSALRNPAIICTGAAIAFLSGRQANIPVWADRLMLGWLIRSLREPAKYLPRYWAALRLAPLLWKHGERSVAAKD
jgi:N-acetylglucosaminyldiphosphoundecaprenol N-acetyl-beta-D-mannosaminyltransferase